MYASFSAVDDSLYGINVSYLVSRSTTTKIELKFISVIGSLDGSSFIIKSNNTKLHTFFETYNDYSSLYRRSLPFLVY